MAYDLTNNVQSIPDLLSFTNGIVGGDLVIIFMNVIIFMVVYVSAGRGTDSSEESLIYASWVTVISSLMTTLLMQASPVLFLIPIILFITSIFLYKKKAQTFG